MVDLPGREVTAVAAAAGLGRSAREVFAMRWLPGTDVTAIRPKLTVRIVERCTRPGYTALEAMRQSRRVGKEVLQSPFFAAEQFLVYYERNYCPRLNRLHNQHGALGTRGRLDWRRSVRQAWPGQGE